MRYTELLSGTYGFTPLEAGVPPFHKPSLLGRERDRGREESASISVHSICLVLADLQSAVFR